MTREIPLSQGLVALVDDEDYERVVAAGKWSAAVRGNTAYARRNVRHPDGRQSTVFLHAFLTGYAVTDHIDGDGLNNTRANLREATNAENSRNARLSRSNSSGFKGVAWHKRAQKWQAKIRVDRRWLWLGQYTTREAAAAAYDDAARELHGEFAAVNFPQLGERAA